MRYKALTSFSGLVSMAVDEVREISDQSIADDLLHAGYIMEMKADTKNETKPRKKKGEK